LRSIIADGEREGLGVAEIARRIQDRFTDTSALRAQTIARTETHNAATYATDQAAESTGLKFEREWVAAEDNQTRPDHRAADGQRAGMDEPFTVGGAKLSRPGDPDGPPEQIINCRCIVTYETPARLAQRRPSTENEGTEGGPPVFVEPSFGGLEIPAQRQAAEYVLKQGAKENREFAALVNLRTQKIGPAVRGAGPSEVDIPSRLLMDINRPRNRWAVHHNHPSDKSFSEEDLIALTENPGFYELWSHGHGGAHFRLAAPDRDRLAKVVRLVFRKRTVISPLLKKMEL
jgi:SPP1 gp7 family putative phage head morphogenesis protein